MENIKKQVKIPKVLNKYTDDCRNAVYIGRGSKYGNPYVIDRDGTREEVVEKYRKYIEGYPELIALVKRNLRGKNLVCYCAPKSCHGDILLEIANGN